VYGTVSEFLASGIYCKILVQYIVGTSPKWYLKKGVFFHYYYTILILGSLNEEGDGWDKQQARG
jgi:hypothetical protein